MRYTITITGYHISANKKGDTYKPLGSSSKEWAILDHLSSHPFKLDFDPLFPTFQVPFWTYLFLS